MEMKLGNFLVLFFCHHFPSSRFARGKLHNRQSRTATAAPKTIQQIVDFDQRFTRVAVQCRLILVPAVRQKRKYCGVSRHYSGCYLHGSSDLIVTSWKDCAFVSGAHSMTNALVRTEWSSLKYESHSDHPVIHDLQRKCLFPSLRTREEMTGRRFFPATGGSGYAAVGARDSKVGVGGFSTGGGIGFLAGHYGHATDRLAALEVGLPDGKAENAIKQNKYSDFLFAFRGGGG